MVNYSRVVVLFVAVACMTACANMQDNPSSLKEAFQDYFYIGVALNTKHADGSNSKAGRLAATQFNSIVAENCMKARHIQPEEGEFFFEDADQFVAFGEEHDMHIVGHTLLWHSGMPPWFFIDEEGGQVSPEVLKERMRTHIHTLVSRYKGRVHGWDVINEALEDNGELRNSEFLQILGEDYLRLAFEYAHEADPGAELYYNDYSMIIPAKRDAAIQMIKNLQRQGVRIDGVGMQGHYSLIWPTLDSFEESLLTLSELGITVMVTEFDISVLPWPGDQLTAEVTTSYEFQQEFNPYPDSIPNEVAEKLNQRYIDFFEILVRYHEKVSRVTFWGLTDQYSWRNYWPVRERTDYPLLFDRHYQPKAAVDKLIHYYGR